MGVAVTSDDTPDEWVSGDGIHWLWFPVFSEWHGWHPDEDGLFCYSDTHFRQVYPDAPVQPMHP